MGIRVLAALVAMVVVGALGAFPAVAQTQVGGFQLEGEVEAGLRLFLVEPSESRKGKFEEYRDLPEGPFLGRLQLRLFRPDERYGVEFEGSKWGQEDQEFALRAGQLGLWQFGFEWDQMRHVFSTTARMLATESDRGAFTLPTPRPALSTYNAARGLDEISTRWDTARLTLVLTPTPELDLRAEYTRINKDGDRPMGMAFGSPGNNFLEVLEPIEQTVHDFRLHGTLARETWQLQFGYALSVFQNSVSRLIADNPCFGLPAALPAGCGTGDGGAAAPARGQLALPPDNLAHTFSLAGGVSLPLRTRLTASLSYSLRVQDEPFLPHTVNPAITSPTLTLPQDSLNGLVGVTQLNLNLTSRPLRPLTLSLRYRLFDLNDMSDEPVFAGHVVNDRTLVIEERKAGRFEYTRHNLDADARFRLLAPLSLTLGGGWERWDRNEHREVPTSDEIYAKAAVDATPWEWLQARLTYRPSFRRIDRYNTFAHLAHTVVEELTPTDFAQSQSTLLRKFDEGERDRQRVDVLLQLTPTEALTLALTGGWINDDYLGATFGLQDATTWSTGLDVTWAPAERISVFGGYTRESIFQKQRSRSRPVTGTTTFDFPDFDWVAVNTDTVDTLWLGARVTLIPRRLDWQVSGSWAYALGRIETRNPAPPTSGTAAQRTTAEAKPMPAFEDTLIRIDTALRYHFWKVWTLSFFYAYESFQKNDWRTDRLNPFVPGVSSIWLGTDSRNYAAHLVGLTVGYRIK